jgi:hypothetical protein
MSANAGTIAGRRPFQAPAGVVIVAMALLVGALAVVVTTPPTVTTPSTTVEQSTPLFRDDAAEMAALKAAIGREWAAERFAGDVARNPDTTELTPGLSDPAEMAALKAAIGREWLAEHSGSG